MKLIIQLLLSILMIVIGGCATERGFKTFNVSQSGCIKSSRSVDLDTTWNSIRIHGVDIDFITKFSVSIYPERSKCNIEIKNVHFTCGGSVIVPKMIVEDSTLIINLEERFLGNLSTPCLCPFDISFDCEPIPSGNYRLYVTKKSKVNILDGEEITLHENELYYYYHYTDPFSDLNTFNDEEQEFLDEYFTTIKEDVTDEE